MVKALYASLFLIFGLGCVSSPSRITMQEASDRIWNLSEIKEYDASCVERNVETTAMCRIVEINGEEYWSYTIGWRWPDPEHTGRGSVHGSNFPRFVINCRTGRIFADTKSDAGIVSLTRWRKEQTSDK